MTPQNALRRAHEAHQHGRWDEAEQLCRAVLRQSANQLDALNLLGILAAQTNRAREAVALLSRAVALDAGNPVTLNNLGNALRGSNQPIEALACFERALALRPDLAELHNNRGAALHDLKRYDEALASYDRAIALRPDSVKAHGHRGNTLRELKRYEEALASYERAISIRPDDAEVHNNRGAALLDLGRRADALESCERALAIRPDYVEAHFNCGNALVALGRTEDAVQSYARAIQLKPDHAQALNNQGNALFRLGRATEALSCYEQAVALKPDYAEAYNNFGSALLERGQLLLALVALERAIALNPDYAEAHFNRGNALQRSRRYAEAAVSYERALGLKPDYRFLPGILLYTRMQVCDWTAYESTQRDLEHRIGRGEDASPAFQLLALSGDPGLQHRVMQAWTRAKFPANPALGPCVGARRNGRIRIGYYSADFLGHATSHLIAELFELHDRSRFELIGLSFGPAIDDPMRRRVEAAFDRFIDVRAQDDLQVALLSRELEIDIAVDLKGFTENCRTGIFALRAAPVQVNFLGFPGTLGADYIDYIIADTAVIPRTEREHYTEKVVWLPDSYQVNDRKRHIADDQFTREALGLPPTGFVFCCFNNNYKITPHTFAGWMRILKRVESSVLWLLEDNAEAAVNLRDAAQQHKVSVNRLVFAKRVSPPEHLARHRCADLFLDTLPCNAHTTASDALWAGLPVLTCIGRTFAGRVAASLLGALDLPELIADTPAQYESLAIELANNPAALARLKAKVRENRLVAPLFDTPRYARHLEAAYGQMFERSLAGLSPDHIVVQP